MGISVIDIARPVVELARDGLKRQGAGEESYLDGVSERVLTEGISPADILIENFEGPGTATLDRPSSTSV
jgi:gamma-glutamylcysteine synthetase